MPTGLLIDFIFLIIMVITSFLYYGKYKNTKLKLLPWIFVFSLTIEIIAYLLFIGGHPNMWIYNGYINIEYLFFLWLFYHYIENKFYKKLIIIGSAVYEIYFIISLLFLTKNLNTMQTYPFTFAQILIIIVLFIFLLQMLSSDKILHIQKFLVFWVALGLLFYYIVPLPLNVSENLLYKNNLSREMIFFLRQIQYIANTLLYTLITYGYIWSSKTYTSQ